MGYDVEILDVQPRPAAIVRGEVPSAAIADFLGKAFAEVLRTASAQGAAPAGPPLARYEPHPDGSFGVEAGFPVSGPVTASGRVEPVTLPGGPLARTLHVGAYSGVAAAYEEVGRWLPEHGYTVVGPPWESYLDGPEVVEPRTEVNFPCRRNG